MIKSIALALTLVAAPFYAAATDIVEGTHYTVIPDVTASSKPKVTEFLSLYCHNCFNMETNYLADIKANLDKKVEFDTKHVDFMNSEIGTEVMRSLAVIQQSEDQAGLTRAMFAAIQGAEGANGHDHNAKGDSHEPKIKSRDDIKKVFAQFGITPSKYDALADSKETEAKLALWREQQKLFGIQGVPSFVVNDKYIVNLRAMKTVGDVSNTINYLATKKDEKR